MYSYSKKLEEIKKLEENYEIALTREGLGELMSIVWKNIKGEFSEEPNILILCERIMLEELLIYAVAINGEQGYNKIISTNELNASRFQIKKNSEITKSYGKYIFKIKKYFEEHPERCIEIFN